MKKLLALLMAVLMVVSLAACGKPAAPKSDGKVDESLLADSTATVTVDGVKRELGAGTYTIYGKNII